MTKVIRTSSTNIETYLNISYSYHIVRNLCFWEKPYGKAKGVLLSNIVYSK